MIEGNKANEAILKEDIPMDSMNIIAELKTNKLSTTRWLATYRY
jgi:hypothetical protein